MEATVSNVATLSVSFMCAYDKAFEYLANPYSQKEWAVKFVREVEEEGGVIMATVPFGKVPLRIDADARTGVLDIYLGDGRPTCTRLIEVAEGHCQYNFTLVQPHGMPDAVWEAEGLPNMHEELALLKTLLEAK